ncbi:MAG: U32 family peptidase [Ruminiclostridium sp.]|nr:U32 family peptidase [Ruminiclostridium sp.]
MIEILAPCGGEDSLPAALNSGADAVYIGVTEFSARRNAKNYSEEQLRRAVRDCHISGVKVYVTLNTLVFDDELTKLEKTAAAVAEAGADAVIIQDPGAAVVIHKAAPFLKLHASTQMTVTSASGAEFARKHGFSRVVLAREMSLKETERITKNVDIETEVFVHGALCVCMSGQCLMSAMYGGRSGNRGLCAQPCRLDFTSGGRHNVMSLKDLSVIEHLRELEHIGVTSAKIEGRMKRPEYVSAAVAACRDVLDGKKPDIERLRAVFSRSGFTSSYFDGSLRDMQGIRTKDDVEAAGDALAEIKQSFSKPYKRHTADISVTVSAGTPVTADVCCEGISFRYVSDIIPETAVRRDVTADEISERLRKTGGTIYEFGNISVSLGEGLMLTVSSVNGIRRGIIALLDKSFEEKNSVK